VSMNSKNPNKWKGEVVEINSKIDQNANLQDKFSKFRDQRMKKHAMQNNLQTINDNEVRSDPERMDILRSKFLEQCKKY